MSTFFNAGSIKRASWLKIWCACVFGKTSTSTDGPITMKWAQWRGNTYLVCYQFDASELAKCQSKMTYNDLQRTVTINASDGEITKNDGNTISDI